MRNDSGLMPQPNLRLCSELGGTPNLDIFGEQGTDGGERVGLGGGLVGAPAEDAGEADGDARLVPGASG